jgi:hypothetical protein
MIEIPSSTILSSDAQPLVRYRNRAISAADIAFIAELIRANPGLGRTPLSRLLCERWNWRSPTGALKEYACRDLLLRLEEWGHLKLPPRIRKNGQKKKASLLDLKALGVSEQPVEGNVDLSRLVVRPVTDRRERLIWRALVDRYHYLGEGVMCGEHLLYVATLPTVHGDQIVACLGWGAAALRNPKRDEWLGWNFETMKKELYQVSNNLRFLILPWVKVKNLGSRTLALNLRRLSSDWQARYGHALTVAETFVDISRFRGTVYQAANWKCLGQTAGRQKRGNALLQIGRGAHGQSKAIYVYPLNEKATKARMSPLR